ncbi:MAG: TlpA disulfide reductase family protein [Bacteroidales bacterium]|nr:TlpA disulfide reductase family protein [Bacteroidales bacterium]MDD4217047.1 TlpA disulfide reductase family protein [Bacteroidales bacterium]MDY0142669.1 TlpA disulfide reductase family protein [Bacteroidales bacterium]
MKKSFVIILVILYASLSFGQNVGIEIGNIAPDIKLPTPKGDSVNLYSLRGQIVLIDFWASWCGPCRKENPAVVEAYNEHKNKSFTIGEKFTVFGVSLDKNKESWEKAIKDDGLSWTNVSDLLYWNCASAKDYNVKGIPANFLIDGKGVIIAKNLRGEKLENELEKYIRIDPVVVFEMTLNELELEYNLLESSEKYADKKELKKIKKNIGTLKKIVQGIK